MIPKGEKYPRDTNQNNMNKISLNLLIEIYKMKMLHFQ